MMNIVYLLADPGIGVFGSKGASVHVQEVVRAMRGLGHHVTVLCIRRGERDGTELVPDDLADLPVITVPVRSASGSANREFELIATVDKMVEIAAGLPCDLIYERYSLFSDVGARLNHLAPVILEVNAPLIDEQTTHRRLHHVTLARVRTLAAFSGASLLSCVSRPVADWVATLCPAAPVVVTPNGVNTDRVRPGVRLPGQPLTVGFLGTLKPWHGTDVLLDAVGTARSTWRVEICGTGPELDALREQATRLSLDVVFHGAVAPADVPEILTGWDVATAPYPATDNHYFSPLKVYEYLAAGLPVIASAVGELPELLGDCGVLTTPGDTDSLAAALDRLAGDRAERERLGRRGRVLVETHHTWRSRVTDLLAGVFV